MESESALIWTDSAVELHPVSCVGLDLSVVIHPCHLESEDSVRFHKPLHNLCILEFRMPVVSLLDGFQHFAHCLEILFLIWILGL